MTGILEFLDSISPLWIIGAYLLIGFLLGLAWVFFFDHDNEWGVWVMLVWPLILILAPIVAAIVVIEEFFSWIGGLR